VWYSPVQADGCLAGWKTSTAAANEDAGRGYPAVVIDGSGVTFRFGRTEQFVADATGDIVEVRILDEKVNGEHYYWNSAALAEVGGKKYAYIFGGYKMAHGPWEKQTYRAEAVLSTSWNWRKHGPAYDRGQPYKGTFYSPDGNTGWIYVADLDGNLRKISVDSNGNLGSWHSAGSNFPGTGHGDYFVHNGQMWVIQGSKVYVGDIDPATGNIANFSDDPPDLPTDQIEVDWRWTDTEGQSYGIYNNTLYVTGKDRVYFLPLNGDCSPRSCPATAPDGGATGGTAGDTMACVVPEWLCTGSDVLVPPVTCKSVWVGTPNPEYTPAPGEQPPSGGQTSCRTCKESYIFPQPEWVNSCPTNQDTGQKDGTAYSGTARTYNQFDYEHSSLINVPPFSWGTGAGGEPIAPTPKPTITGIPNVPEDVPCGWPNRAEDSRRVTNVCSSGACPNQGIDNASYCAAHSHTYPAIDVGGGVEVFSTMEGTAYLCQDPGDPSYGVYA